MTDFACPNCSPREHILGDSYYAVEWQEVVNKDGVVNPETGAVTRTDHKSSVEILYAKCVDCDEMIIDNRD